ncbi:MAG: hypothetical protein ACYDA3_01950 [Gaiellaceae bacterium]
MSADERAVMRGDAAGGFLRRGLTVAGFNLLETFVSQRLNEFAAFLNAGHVQFLDLPEKLQRHSIVNTVRVANSRLRRPEDDLNLLRGFSREVGESLAAVGTSLQLSAMTWLWEGSNMAPANYHDTLRRFHVYQPWQTGGELATRLGIVQPDLERALRDLAQERHKSAHEALYGVTPLWLRSIPNRILTLAAVFDILASVACVQLRAGDPAFMQDDEWLTSARIRLRFVRERTRGAAEILEGRTRASRVSDDAARLFGEAVGRAAQGEVVVRQDMQEQVATWDVPPIG